MYLYSRHFATKNLCETLGDVETRKLIKSRFFFIKISKNLQKTIDIKCIRCYNITVSRVSYALMEVAIMLLEELRQATKRSVGVKQTEKAVIRGTAAKVYIAEDADYRVTFNLSELCKENGVELIRVESMSELGRACGIHVKAAAAVILKD